MVLGFFAHIASDSSVAIGMNVEDKVAGDVVEENQGDRAENLEEMINDSDNFESFLDTTHPSSTDVIEGILDLSNAVVDYADEIPVQPYDHNVKKDAPLLSLNILLLRQRLFKRREL